MGRLVALLGQKGSDRRTIEARSGKMPTTSVRRRISLLSRVVDDAPITRLHVASLEVEANELNAG